MSVDFSLTALSLDNLVVVLDDNLATFRCLVFGGLMDLVTDWLAILLNENIDFLVIVDWNWFVADWLNLILSLSNIPFLQQRLLFLLPQALLLLLILLLSLLPPEILSRLLGMLLKVCPFFLLPPIILLLRSRLLLFSSHLWSVLIMIINLFFRLPLNLLALLPLIILHLNGLADALIVYVPIVYRL